MWEKVFTPVKVTHINKRIFITLRKSRNHLPEEALVTGTSIES
jgi:hypothetical protein